MYCKEESTKCINSSKVYSAANCKRFDVFVNDVQIKFFERLEDSNDTNIANYERCTYFEEMSNQRYKSPAYMYELAKNNLRFEDSIRLTVDMLIFLKQDHYCNQHLFYMSYKT